MPEKIIDVFINATYVYDDKIVTYYNVKEGRRITCIDVCNDMETLNFAMPEKSPDARCDNLGTGVRIKGNTLW